MSISHLKKQAKNLKKIIPEFIQNNPNGISLSVCQEMIAQTHGFPSWNDAVQKSQRDNNSKSDIPIPSLGHLKFKLTGLQHFNDLDDNGELASQTEAQTGRFIASPKTRLNKATEAHDNLTSFFDGFDSMNHIEIEDLLVATKKLINTAPEFLDGHSYVVGCLITLGKYKEAVEVGLPYIQAADALLPNHFSGRINYFELDNRPYHRLNANVVIALHHVGKHTEAKVIAEKMLKFWPTDNMGFRFLLDGLPPD